MACYLTTDGVTIYHLYRQGNGIAVCGSDTMPLSPQPDDFQVKEKRRCTKCRKMFPGEDK